MQNNFFNLRRKDIDAANNYYVIIADKAKALALAIASRLECGIVRINAHGMIQLNVPFGGVKGSGIGVEFGIDGLKEHTTIQAIFA
ncbi:MAG: aldehyde dehydrogenase family protein [Robiginitomaculum sp.]